ncbi:MAG: hypothetical protein AB1861_28150 [Cyanobacteriota bacterium]
MRPQKSADLEKNGTAVPLLSERGENLDFPGQFIVEGILQRDRLPLPDAERVTSYQQAIFVFKLHISGLRSLSKSG